MGLAWQGLIWGLFLLACPGCQAEVQVSVPQVMEVLLGEPVSIFCTHTVTGEDSFLLVEWFITDKNGEQRRVAYSDRGHQGVDRSTEYTDRVSMDPSHSLVIHAADVTDERPFSCQVTVGAVGSGMGETHLKVYDPPEPPELTYESRIRSVTERHATEIATCSSRNAIPVPTITWYKDGHLLNASSDHNKELYTVSRTVKEASGLYSVSNTLYLHLNKADKDSKFQCRVNYSMPHGKVGNAASEVFQITLHYYTENVAFALDSPQVIKEGDTVQLRCTSDAYPPPEYVFSRVQAKDVSEDLGTNLEGVLVLQKVTKADSGTYRCQALDFDSPSEVELEKEVTIFVNYLDPLVLHPNETAVGKLGGNLELSCAGTGSETPILSWRKDKEHMADGGLLSLQSLTYHMAGTYECEASVPSIPGLRREQSVRVIVEGVPQMEQHQSVSHYDHLGQTVKLMCSALGYPEPKIAWNVSGLETDLKTVANGVIGELSVEVTPELVQSGVKCVAKNKHGAAEQLFHFRIVAPTMPASPGSAVDGEESQGGSTVAVIAVCVCVLILLLIVAFFYFMQRRGQLPCGGGEKRSLTPKEGSPDDTVVEMKTDKRNEQTGLLSHSGGGVSGGGGTNEC